MRAAHVLPFLHALPCPLHALRPSEVSFSANMRNARKDHPHEGGWQPTMHAGHRRRAPAGRGPFSANERAVLAQAVGAELDLSDKGLGIRSRRYALLADDGVVRARMRLPPF